MQKIIYGMLCACTALSFATVGLADTRVQEYVIEIARQPITETLREFSKQTGLDVSLVIKNDAQADLLVGPLKGRYTVESALNELLGNSGFTFTRLNAGTIAVIARDGKRAGLISKTKNASKPRLQQLADRTIVDEAKVESEPQRVAAVSTEGSEAEAGRVNRSTRAKGMEEVVVTAQRRQERLQDVPISISVMTGERLDKSNDDVVAALNQVPGVVAAMFNQYGSAYVTVRGVSAGGVGSSTVGYYLDSAPFSLIGSGGAISPDANSYDLNRIEVLRGPQGTLYGVNSFAGVVRILTNNPDLNNFEAKGRLSSSTTKDGGGNYRGDAAVNVPLVDGKFAARAVVGIEDVSGWIERPNNSNANDGTLHNVRLKLGAQPIDQLRMDLSAWHSKAEYNGIPASSDAGTRNVLFDESLSLETDLYDFTLSYDFPTFTIVSSTSNLSYDTDSVKRSIFSANFLKSILNAEIFTQEVNLSSAGEGRFRWSAGGAYRDGEELYQGKGPTAFANIPGAPLSSNFTTSSESWAVFGEGTYRFIDTVALTLGMRYFNDDHDAVNRLAQNFRTTASFHATTPRVTLTWDPSNDLTAYASYSQGFRSGRIANPFATAAGFGDVKPDRLHNYEIGAKGNVFGGYVSFDAAAYYMEWKDIQQSLAVPVGASFAGIELNGGSASGPGVEISTVFRPMQSLNMSLNLSWNDLTLDADALSGGVVLFAKGSRLNSSAEYTYGGTFDYTSPLGSSDYEAHLSASANYHSDLFSRSYLGTIVIVPADPILVGRASLAVGPMSDQWRVTLFVDNFTNERGATLAKWSPPGQADEGVRLRPRTFGAQLECNF